MISTVLNTGLGIMTTIVPGVYFWNCAVMKTAAGYSSIVLIHDDGLNEREIQWAHSNDSRHYEMLSVTATIELNLNDRVWLTLYSGVAHSITTRRFGSCTSFRVADL